MWVRVRGCALLARKVRFAPRPSRPGSRTGPRMHPRPSGSSSIPAFRSGDITEEKCGLRCFSLTCAGTGYIMSTSSRAALRCAEATTTSYYDKQAASFDHIPFGPRLLPELLRSCLPSTAIGADGRMEHEHGRIGGDDDGDGYGDIPKMELTALVSTQLHALVQHPRCRLLSPDVLLCGSSGMPVQDVGSGPGALAAWLRDEMCYTVECVDPSRAMAERCCAKGLRAHQCPIQDYVPRHEEQVLTPQGWLTRQYIV